MVEAIANLVRAFPVERARDGQPYVSSRADLRAAAAHATAMEWSLNVRCEPALGARRSTPRSTPPTPTSASAAATPSAARPRRRAARPRPRAALPQAAQLRLPAASPPTRRSPRRRWSRSRSPRSRCRRPSVVRFQLTPAPSCFEELARRRYRRHENRLVAPGALGPARGRPDLDAQPRRDAQRRAHPEPQPVLARARRRRRQRRTLQDARRRRAGPPRREPPAPPLDARAPATSTAGASRTPSARCCPRRARSSPPPRSRTCSRCPPRA